MAATWCQPESVTVVVDWTRSPTVARRSTSRLLGLNMSTQEPDCCDAITWLPELDTEPRFTQASIVNVSPTSSGLACGTVTCPVAPSRVIAVSGSPDRAPTDPSVTPPA